MYMDNKPSGILAVHKTVGVSTQSVINSMKKHFRENHNIKKIKIGHAGALDPNSSGLLVIGFGKGTKLLSQVSQNKTYRVGIILDHCQTPQGPQQLSQNFFSFEQIQTVLNNMIGSFEYYSTVKNAKQVPKKKICNITKVVLVSYTWPKLVLDICFEGSANLEMVVTGVGNSLGTSAILGGVHRLQQGNISLGEISPGGFQQIQ